MIIGVPKEIKNNENRIGITPAGVEALVSHGHKVYVEKDGGLGSGITNEEFTNAGAELLATAAEVWATAEMVIKVKEPIASEYQHFRPGLILFTYLHLAAEEALTKALAEKEVVAIAYETVEDINGTLPLLTPMSEVAGRLATQMGANFQTKYNGGAGVLLGGVPGVEPAKVVVVGGGVVGINAAKMAKGLGADVYILDINPHQLRYLDDIFHGNVKTVMSNKYNLARLVKDADVVVGAVLIPGAKAPRLITDEMIASMKPGSVIVDVAIDQGGCVEGIVPTTHENPVNLKHGVILYSVANMPGSVARTSTYALTNATLPYAVKLANLGYKKAMEEDPGLAKGMNVYQGKVVCQGVSEAFGLCCTRLEDIL